MPIGQRAKTDVTGVDSFVSSEIILRFGRIQGIRSLDRNDGA